MRVSWQKVSGIAPWVLQMSAAVVGVTGCAVITMVVGLLLKCALPSHGPPAPLPVSVPAAGLASNCSCNCIAPKVILLAEGWAQAPAFVAAVKAELAQLPLPAPYYPGLRQRYQAFKEQYPQVLQAPFSLA